MSALTETIFRRALQVHDAVYCNTPGWIGHQRLGVPRRLLHTVGAKTGKPRTTSLSFARKAEHDLIVASIAAAPSYSPSRPRRVLAGQLMLRCRSPGAYSRTPANSMPSPNVRAACSPR